MGLLRPLPALLLAAALAGADGTAPILVPRIDGEVVHADLVEIGPLSVRDVVGVPRLLDGELVFSDCQARAYLGTVTGVVGLAVGDGRIRARVDLAGADLDTIVRRFGANADGLSGRIDGWIEFTMPADRPDLMIGRGVVRVSSANLMQMPLLASLLVGDPLAARNQDQFEASFTIADGRVRLGRAVLTSPAARVEIQGEVSFTGEINLLLTPAFSFQLIDRVWGVGPLVAPVLSLASSKIARAVLRGQIDDPVLVIDPFGRGLE